MFLYPTLFQPRRTVEKLFGVLYLLNVVAAVCGFVVAFADFHDRQTNTFKTFFGSNVLFAFSSPLEVVLSNCTFTSEVRIGFMKGASTLNKDSAPVFFTIAGVILMGTLIVHLVFLATTIGIFALFDLNVSHLRLGGASLPVMTWMILSNIAASVAITCLVWTSEPLMDFGNRYVDFCATRYYNNYWADYINAEYDTKVIFGTNVNWLFGTAMVNLGILFFACLIHLREAMRRGYVLLALGTRPWAKKVLGLPDKNVLRWWSRRRAVLLGTLEETPSADLTILNPFPTYSIVPDYAVLEEQEEEDLERLAANGKKGEFYRSRRLAASSVRGSNQPPQQQQQQGAPPPTQQQPPLFYSPRNTSDARSPTQQQRAAAMQPAYQNWGRVQQQPMSPYPPQGDEDDPYYYAATQQQQQPGLDDDGEAFDPEEEEQQDNNRYYQGGFVDEGEDGQPLMGGGGDDEDYDPEMLSRMEGGELDDAQPEGEDGVAAGFGEDGEPKRHHNKKRKSKKHRHHKKRDEEERGDERVGDDAEEGEGGNRRDRHRRGRIPPPLE